MTAPPSEWPTSTTGPSMVRTRSLMAAASAARPRSGLAAAITRWPSATSGSMTRSQLADSAKAPWTSTMVGRMTFPFGWVGTSVTVAPGVRPPPPCEALVRAPVALSLDRCGCVLGVRERRAELLAGADAELGEHLVEVVFDGAGADEQLGADLLVRVPLLREPGHLRLLRREHVTRLGREPAHRLTRGRQLPSGTLGERLGAEPAQGVVRGAKLPAGVEPPVATTKPFAIDELRARQVRRDACASEALQRLLVQGLGGRTWCHESARPRLQTERPVAAACLGSIGEAIQPLGRGLRLVASDGRLDQLDEDVRVQGMFAGGASPLCRGKCFLVAAETVHQHRVRVVDHAERHALACGRRDPSAVFDEREGLLLVALPGGEDRLGLDERRGAGRVRDC